MSIDKGNGEEKMDMVGWRCWFIREILDRGCAEFGGMSIFKYFDTFLRVDDLRLSSDRFFRVNRTGIMGNYEIINHF